MAGKIVRAMVVTTVAVSTLFGLSRMMNFSPVPAVVALGLQWGFFILHGAPQRSEKLYDASGSLTHLLVVLSALVADTYRSPRQLITPVLSVVWCARLGTFLFNRIAADSKDSRFDGMKENFWQFSVAWNFQAMWVFLLQLPVLVVLNTVQQPPINLLDLAGWALWFTGFLLQSIADAQKFSFRSQKENKGRFITSGLWRYSRHPNYFGEICMWVGLALTATSCINGNTFNYLAWLSPAFDAFLLLFVSGVPMLEKAGEEKWGQEPLYRHYMQNTSCIIPWLPAKELGNGKEEKRTQ